MVGNRRNHCTHFHSALPIFANMAGEERQCDQPIEGRGTDFLQCSSDWEYSPRNDWRTSHSWVFHGKPGSNTQLLSGRASLVLAMQKTSYGLFFTLGPLLSDHTDAGLLRGEGGKRWRERNQRGDFILKDRLNAKVLTLQIAPHLGKYMVLQITFLGCIDDQASKTRICRFLFWALTSSITSPVIGAFVSLIKKAFKTK